MLPLNCYLFVEYKHQKEKTEEQRSADNAVATVTALFRTVPAAVPTIFVRLAETRHTACVLTTARVPS